MIADDRAATRAEGLVPPRPNLGPEPWVDPPSRPGAGWWWASALVLALLLAGWLRRRRKALGAGQERSPEPLPEAVASPRDRLIASSEVVRSALIVAFGPGWRSKTTEEIADEPALSDRLDPDEVGRLVEFLRLADRAKFAEDGPDPAGDWEAWAGSFVTAIGTSSGWAGRPPSPATGGR